MRLLSIKKDLKNRRLLKNRYFKTKIKQSLSFCKHANVKLQNEPNKKYSKIFCYNYCNLTGRRGGSLHFFGVSRMAFRKLFENRLLFSVKKASW